MKSNFHVVWAEVQCLLQAVAIVRKKEEPCTLGEQVQNYLLIHYAGQRTEFRHNNRMKKLQEPQRLKPRTSK
jgi:hypothetical protein